MTTLKNHPTIHLILRAILGLSFLFSGISKLLAIDSFEVYVYSLGLLTLNLSTLAARFLIGSELLLGLLLILLGKNRILLIVTGLLLILFTILLIFQVAIGEQGNCHCFGELLPMSHGISILKNVVLILLVHSLIRLPNPCIGLNPGKIPVLAAALVIAALPFVVSPPDFMVSERYAKDSAYNPALLSDFLEEQNLVSGDYVLCFYGATCSYCKMANRKLEVMRERYSGLPVFRYYFLGSQEQIAEFVKESGPADAETTSMNPLRFIALTNGHLPLILLVSDGNVRAKFGYRDIDEEAILQLKGR